MNREERSIDCGGSCGLCKTDYIFIFILILAIIFFLYVSGREVAHLIAEHYGNDCSKIDHLEKELKHIEDEIGKI